MEPILREHVDVLHGKAEQGQGYVSSRESKTGIEWFSFRLGNCLLHLRKFQEAEEVLDRALHLSMELVRRLCRG